MEVADAVRMLALVTVAAGCRGTEPTPPPATPVAGQEAAAAPARPGAGCDLARLPPALAAYDEIVAGIRFSLELEENADGVWVPANRLHMPLHHASTIAWEDAQALEDHRGGRVVVEATGLGRMSLEHDPDRRTWFAVYGARIDRVCPLAGSGG